MREEESLCVPGVVGRQYLGGFTTDLGSSHFFLEPLTPICILKFGGLKFNLLTVLEGRESKIHLMELRSRC